MAVADIRVTVKVPTIIARIVGARTMTMLTRRPMPELLFLGPQEAHDLLAFVKRNQICDGDDVDGRQLYGMTIRCVSEPGVAVA